MLHHPSIPPELLFSKIEWDEAQALQKKRLADEIEAISEKELLAKSTEEQARDYAEKYKFEVPVIDTDNKDINQREAKIQMQDPFESQPFYVDGVTIDVGVPFAGDKVGFDIRASQFSLNPPRAEIGNKVIKFSISGANLKEEEVSSKIKRTLESIQKYLDWLAKDVKTYNAELEGFATKIIEQRKKRISENKSLLDGIKNKIK